MLKILLFLYTAIYILALTVLIPYQIFKRPKGLRKRWLRERFFCGRTGELKSGRPEEQKSSRASIWLHAVSVGETIAATSLIKELLRNYPEHLIILTTVTDTGQDIGRKRFSSENRVKVMYMPFDIRWIVKRFLKTFDIRLMITIETELWPNTFVALSEKNIPLFIVNGRLSERSFKSYRKVRFFMGNILKKVSLFMMASEIDRKRLLGLGVPENKVFVTGNIKFDLPDIPPPKINFITGRKILLLASTHSTEERIIIDSLLDIIRHKEVFIVLAPRHPERFSEVERLLNGIGIRFVRRTDVNGTILPDEEGIDLLLLNTIGELASFYSLADIVIMGGSFIPQGGHNILEPAYWSKAVVTGPYMHNFPLSGEFFSEGGAIMTDVVNLKNTILRLLDEPSLRVEIGKNANKIFKRNSGALKKTLTLIKERFNN